MVLSYGPYHTPEKVGTQAQARPRPRPQRLRRVVVGARAAEGRRLSVRPPRRPCANERAVRWRAPCDTPPSLT